MTTIILTGAYGYDPYHVDGLASGTVIDASAASWIHDNDDSDGDSNPYPVNVLNAPNVTIKGGLISGNFPLDEEWRDIYDRGNNGAVRTEDCANVTIRDWKITNTWDAVKVSWNCPNFVVENIWVENARDDAMENDRLQSGLIKNCLFDGMFAGISIDPSSSSPVDGHNNTVVLDGVLLRLRQYPYEGLFTHSSFIKTDSATPNTMTPNLRFLNCVFALEDVNHRSYRSMRDAWAKAIEVSECYYLNLTDSPFPTGYPMPPSGFTVLSGQAARDFWATARQNWITAREGTAPPPPEDEMIEDIDTAPNEIDYDAAAGTPVGITASIDLNEGETVTWAVSDSRFAIDEDGIVTRSSTGTLNAATEPTINLTVTGTVTKLDGESFTISVLGSVAPSSQDVQIATSLGDVEEVVSSGAVNATSGDIELVTDGSSPQIVGLRFPGCNVPQGATITNAYVQFTVDEATSNACSLTIKGQAHDNAPAFTTTTSNVSSRADTTASVNWTPAAWPTVGAAGVDQRTPDIKTIIQEIVNRSGWASGNAIVLKISGTGKRTAASYNGNAAGAAKLHLEWS